MTLTREQERDEKVANLEARFDQLVAENELLINQKELQKTSEKELLIKQNESISVLEDKVRNLERESAIAKIHRLFLEKSINQNEQYSRKQNLVIDGLRIKKDDTDVHIRNLIIKEINNLELDIKDFEVVRAHRTGSSYVDKKGVRHTPVLCRFATWRPRDIVYKARNQSRYFFKADLTSFNSSALKYATDSIRNTNSSANRLIDYAFADRNCKLTIKSKDGRYLHFNSETEFDRQVDYIEDTQPPYEHIMEMLDKYFYEFEVREINLETRLVNLTGMDLVEWVKNPQNTYIGRAHGILPESPWANEFKVEQHGRDMAISMYREKLMNSPSLKDDIQSLVGRSLGCWCASECHGEVLLDLINKFS